MTAHMKSRARLDVAVAGGGVVGAACALALEGAAYHHFLQLHAFVQYDVFFQCTACGDGDFQFYGRVAHVAHLYCIGSRVKVRESVEAVDVARHASV